MLARIGSWQDNNLQIKAGREAVKMIDYYIKNDISFHQETTLYGESIIMNIKKKGTARAEHNIKPCSVLYWTRLLLYKKYCI